MVALAFMITACSGGSAPDDARPVTVAESELLAGLRSENVDAGSRKVSATFIDQGRETELTGWFDYTTGTGYATVSADGLPSDRITWNGELVATSDGRRQGMPLNSLKGWTAAPLDPGTSSLAALLAVLARLGADRPDDAASIRADGVQWLREDEIEDTAVTVFAAPSSRDDEDTQDTGDDSRIRYWVDDDGLAHRVDVRLGDEWAEVTLENDDVAVPPLLAGIHLDAEGGVVDGGMADADATSGDDSHQKG